MEILVTNRQRKTGISTEHVRLLACRVLENESVRLARLSPAARGEASASFDEISINFLGARAVRSLNRKFTGRDEVTDTLAFEMAPFETAPGAGGGGRVSRRRPRTASEGRARRDPPSGRGVRLGDVVVCVDRAAEQAEEYGVGLGDELARLTIHGILHLCGLDDATREQRQRMSRREDFYLRRFAPLVRCLVPKGRN